MIERLVIGEHVGDEWTMNFGEYNHETDVAIPKNFALKLLNIKKEFVNLKAQLAEREKEIERLKNLNCGECAQKDKELKEAKSREDAYYSQCFDENGNLREAKLKAEISAQAEKIREQEATIAECRNAILMYQDGLKQQEATIGGLRSALQFYANEKNYDKETGAIGTHHPGNTNGGNITEPDFEPDMGYVAEKALKALPSSKATEKEKSK